MIEEGKALLLTKEAVNSIQEHSKKELEISVEEKDRQQTKYLIIKNDGFSM